MLPAMSNAPDKRPLRPWMLWAALGGLAGLVIGFLLERRGYDSFAEWLFDWATYRGDASAWLWLLIGAAIGALIGALRSKR